MRAGEHELAVMRVSDGAIIKSVDVLEMPEDEFYFFRAFRQGLFDLENELPTFIYALGQVNAYSLFESYIAKVLRDRLSKHPECLGAKKQIAYSEIFSASSKEALIDTMIDREINDILYLPITGLLDCLRNRLGFSRLSIDRDARLVEIALIRNCVVHNDGMVSARLAAEFPETYKLGDELDFGWESFRDCLDALKKISVAIDYEWEALA